MGICGLWGFYIKWRLVLSIHQYICSTTLPWKLFLNIISSQMMTQQVFSTWQAIKLTLSIFNDFHRMRAFPFNFKRYSILKRTFILLRWRLFNFIVNVFSMYYWCSKSECSFGGHFETCIGEYTITAKV